MGVLLLETGLVEVRVTGEMHQVQFVYQTTLLEHFERAVHGNAVQLGVLLLGQLVEPLGVQVLTGLVDQLEKDLPLPRETYALLLQRAFHALGGHITIVRWNSQNANAKMTDGGGTPAAHALLFDGFALFEQSGRLPLARGFGGSLLLLCLLCLQVLGLH